MATAEKQEEPWWAKLPAPKADCPSIEASEVLTLLEGNSPKDFLLVDVRRTDWEGGTVRDSINLPAHTLYQTRKVVYELCKQAGLKRIIFYCGSCSRGGRGWRCANWMQDFIDEQGDKELQSMMLQGGMRGWAKTYGGKQVDWYEEEYWKQFQ